jgi:peptidoglycan/LPS O-acetylase OafA/YrhL
MTSVGGMVSEGDRDRALGRMPALDGLRTIAVVLTSLVHVAPGVVPGGFLGVDVFFVLSGFLITSILLQEVGETGRLDLRRFYVRRARRLLPAVIALLVVFTAVVLLTSPTRRDIAVAAVVDIAVMTYTFNWTAPLGHLPPWQVDHLWSLSVEEQFYILWPIVLLVLVRRMSRRAIMRLTLAAAVASTVAQTAVYGATHETLWAFLASPLHAQGILLGCFLGQVYVWRGADGVMRWLAGHVWPSLAALVVLVVLAATSGVDDASTYFGGMALAVIASATLVAGVASRAAFAEADTGLLTRVLTSRVMVALGRRSYSIYLWQNFIAWSLTDSLRHSPLWLPANAVVTLVAAELSYRYVERRFMHRTTRQTELVRG